MCVCACVSCVSSKALFSRVRTSFYYRSRRIRDIDYGRCAKRPKTKTLVFLFACILCSIRKWRFCYSTHSGCVFIFFGFWTYVNLRLCVVSGTTPSATLSREHISRGSFEFARTLACLETPTNLRNVSFALERKYPRRSDHQTYPWELDV